MKEIKNDKKMQDFIGRLFNEQYDSQGKGFKELADDIYCCSNGVFGKDDRTARRWINGDVELSLDKLKVLAEVFDVDVAELIEGHYLDSVTLKRENIECKGICTSCHSDRFYSYRKGDKESGRFTAFIQII